MLQLQNLKASVNDKSILNGLNLEIKSGEVHAIMGPNGSGKSTLANILSGKSGYDVSGSLKYEGKNLQEIPIEERAQKGIFLAFQYPLEIPGVNTTNFLKTSLNSLNWSVEVLNCSNKSTILASMRSALSSIRIERIPIVRFVPIVNAIPAANIYRNMSA